MYEDVQELENFPDDSQTTVETLFKSIVYHMEQRKESTVTLIITDVDTGLRYTFDITKVGVDSE